MQPDFRRIMYLLAAEDPAAADEIDRLADQLRALAATLRAGSGITSAEGMADRVQMRVVGPDGQVKHETDTGANP